MKKWRFLYYHTKAFLKHREPWVLLATLILLFFVFKNITLPTVDNTRIGVVTYDSYRASDTVSMLEDTSRVYEVVRYEDEESLKKDVRSGDIECGFIFNEDFDRLVEKGRTRGRIGYVYSPYTTKGLVAKESLFAAFLKNYSNDILEEDYPKMFGNQDESLKEEIMELLRDRNAYYIDSNEIFEVELRR